MVSGAAVSRNTSLRRLKIGKVELSYFCDLSRMKSVCKAKEGDAHIVECRLNR